MGFEDFVGKEGNDNHEFPVPGDRVSIIDESHRGEVERALGKGPYRVASLVDDGNGLHLVREKDYTEGMQISRVYDPAKPFVRFHGLHRELVKIEPRSS